MNYLGMIIPGMSFSLPNMGQVGNWALNNAGDLALGCFMVS